MHGKLFAEIRLAATMSALDRKAPLFSSESGRLSCDNGVMVAPGKQARVP